MDNGDISSDSDSSSDMKKKLKTDGFVDDEDMMEKDGLKAMAKWFIGAEINPNRIQSESFANFLRLMTPNLPLSVPLLEKAVLEVHKEYKDKATKFLKDFQGKFTISYEWMVLGHDWSRDYIKGPILHEDFVCLTAHFIDDNWKVRKWILRYTTDESIPLEDIYVYPFRNAVQDFEIENKVSTILLPFDLDFYEDTIDAIRKCIQEKGNSSINLPVFQLYCCADLFRIMADSLYSGLSWKMLEDVRMLVNWGRCSSTNWNVNLANLQRALDMKSEDEFSKDEIYDDYDKPSDEDWIKIQTFCKLAGCIHKVAKELFEEEYSTSNVYFHLLAELEVMLNQELANADNDYFLRHAKWILKKFDQYWNDMFLVLATASVLDPRFKMKYVEFYCSKKIDNDEGSKAETVLDYLRNLYDSYAASDICQKPICAMDAKIFSDEEEDDYGKAEDDDGESAEEDDDDGEVAEDDVDDGEVAEEDDGEVAEEDDGAVAEEEGDGEVVEGEREADKEEKKPDAYKDFVLFQEYLKFEGSAREFQESELDSYLKEPVLEWNKDFKALEWWKEESQKYPILSRVARDILAIPISRATWFHAYVSDKTEPPEFVLSMEPKVANAMMCAKSWLRI